MISTRQSLIDHLHVYQTSYDEEKEFIIRFLMLLKHPDSYQRTHLPGHITGSAFIINSQRTHSLLVHHAKLNKWLQPGGHADGDENITGVALREANEETGLQNLKLTQSSIFDIDIHVIPARQDFPEHFHFDVRFLLEASQDETIQVSYESHDVRWISLTELNQLTQNDSINRMCKKLLC